MKKIYAKNHAFHLILFINSIIHFLTDFFKSNNDLNAALLNLFKRVSVNDIAEG